MPAAMRRVWLPPPVLGSSPTADTPMVVVVVDGATAVVLVASVLDVVGATVVEVVDVVVGFTVVEVVDVDVVGATVVEVVDVVVGFTVVEVVDVDVVGATVVEVVDVVVVGGGGFQQNEMWLMESFGDARSMPTVEGGSNV
jgi:hypothetical protein